jgi:hypothetical protein
MSIPIQNVLLSQLNDYSRQILSAIRPAWRLSMQKAIERAGVKSPLPAHMLATDAEVEQAFAKHRHRMNRAPGLPIGKLLSEIESEFGPLAKWIVVDGPGMAGSSWQHAAATLEGAESAIGQAEVGIDRALVHAWEAVGRTATTLGFAARAISGLVAAYAAQSLPPGLRAAKVALPGRAVLSIQVLDDDERVLGGSDTDLEGAIADAVRSRIVSQDPHEITTAEFIDVTTVIPVSVGRGKTGLAKHGKSRLLATDVEGLSKLRAFLSEAYRRTYGFGREAPADATPVKEWIDSSVDTLLGESFETNHKTMWVPGAGHLVFSKTPGEISVATLEAFHRASVEEAVESGKVDPFSYVQKCFDIGNNLDQPERSRPRAA